MGVFARNRAALLQRIATFLRDAAGPGARLSTDDLGDVDICIDAALTEFSRDVQREASDPDDLATGTGTRSISLATAAPYWEDGFSRALGFEHPVDELPPKLWQERNWTVDAPRDRILLEQAVSNGDEVRLRYTVRHAVEDFNGETATTISAAMWPAFACLCAAHCSVSLQAFYAGTTDGSAGADIANFRTKAQERSDVERKLRERYQSLLGTSTDGSTPRFALGVVNHDLDDQYGATYLHRQPGAD